jgi:hypothetical protein
MSFHRSFIMGLVVFAVLALPGLATRSFARGESARHPKIAPGDEAQMRELLSRLAAASGQPEKEERTDADLMYEAMIRWNGEPPGSAAIDRLLESSKKEAAKTKKATVEKVRKMFWKDPFSDSPGKLIPVRQEDRELLEAYDRKGRRRGGELRQARAESRDSELARLRAEIDAARSEAAEAQAENVRLRRRAETLSEERRECVADNDERVDMRMRRRASSGTGGSNRSHRHEARQQQVAMSPAVEQRQTPVAPPPPEPIIPATVAPPSPGMVITPLPVTPPPQQQPPLESGRRSRSARPGR